MVASERYISRPSIGETPVVSDVYEGVDPQIAHTLVLLDTKVIPQLELPISAVIAMDHMQRKMGLGLTDRHPEFVYEVAAVSFAKDLVPFTTVSGSNGIPAVDADGIRMLHALARVREEWYPDERKLDVEAVVTDTCDALGSHKLGEKLKKHLGRETQEDMAEEQILIFKENEPWTYEGIVDEDLRTAMVGFETTLIELKERYGDLLTVNRLRSGVMERVLNLKSQQIRDRIEQLGFLGIIPLFNEQMETLKDRTINDETIRALYAFCYIQVRDFPGVSRTQYSEVAVVTVQKLGTDPLRDEFHMPEDSEDFEQRESTHLVRTHTLFTDDTLSADERAYRDVNDELSASDTLASQARQIARTLIPHRETPKVKPEKKNWLDDITVNFDSYAEDENAY